MTLRIFLVLVVIGFISGALNYSCELVSDRKPDEQPAPGTEEGYALAKRHCTTCHGFVSPSSLNKVTWNDKVLPGMAPYLGIGVFGEKDYINNPNYGSGIVSFENWMKIVDYYTGNAPQELVPAIPPVPITKEWSIFEMKNPHYTISPFARTMLVKADTATNNIYTSDGNTWLLYRWNSQLQATDSTYLGSPAVSASFYDDTNGKHNAVFSTLGTMNADDIAEGNLLVFDVTEKLTVPADTTATHLPRPVQSVGADINKDGLADWVVCGFGHNRGGLYWFEGMPKGGYLKHVIANIPGAVQVETGDFNHDGWTDLMVLFAHDDESIRLLTNDQKGDFITSRILTFPPVFGSSSFQLADFNKDGLTDILYSCGDNADLSEIFKPFHGIYIYINTGNGKYDQSYFYPINGCTKAVAADFDKDGDLDIATIAFFADFDNKPGEKFLYFEQDKPLHFIPHSPPVEKNGRWICMDVTDYDRDGDLDIILGNFAKGFMITKDYRPTWDLTTPFMVLVNKTANPGR